MSLQERLQIWMLLQPLLVVDQRRVLAQLFRDFAMAIQELIETGQFPACDIATRTSRVVVGTSVVVRACGGAGTIIHIRSSVIAGLVARLFAGVEVMLGPHEGVRIFVQLFANFRVVL